MGLLPTFQNGCARCAGFRKARALATVVQLLALDRPNELIAAFPLAMIPVFLVPLAVLLHLASWQKLRQTGVAAPIANPLLAAVRS